MNIEPKPISAIDKATITEHLCITKLKKLGYDASIVHMGTSDIVLDVDNILLKVQVKSSKIKKTCWNRPGYGYHFSITKGGGNNKSRVTSKDCDILALVAFERERVLFKHISEYSNRYTMRKHKTFFDEPDILKIERDSLNKALQIHKELHHV